MTREHLAELRRLAEAATKWPDLSLAATKRHSATVRAFNRAANPATILAMLDRVEKLERVAEAARCEYLARGEDCDRHLEELTAALAALDEGTS